jgi:soluble lytic murein transglycosylase
VIGTFWLLAAALLMLCLRHGYVVLYQYHRFDALIDRAAKARGLDPSLVSAVIWRESRFDPYDMGTRGERGLMQVTDEAGHEWAAAAAIPDFSSAALFDPSTNIEAGVWYLARAVQRWADKDDPIPYALAEYNAGRSNARRWAAHDEGKAALFRGQITFPSTRRYIAAILRRYRGRF